MPLWKMRLWTWSRRKTTSMLWKICLGTQKQARPSDKSLPLSAPMQTCSARQTSPPDHSHEKSWGEAGLSAASRGGEVEVAAPDDFGGNPWRSGLRKPLASRGWWWWKSLASQSHEIAVLHSFFLQQIEGRRSCAQHMGYHQGWGVATQLQVSCPCFLTVIFLPDVRDCASNFEHAVAPCKSLNHMAWGMVIFWSLEDWPFYVDLSLLGCSTPNSTYTYKIYVTGREFQLFVGSSAGRVWHVHERRKRVDQPETWIDLGCILSPAGGIDDCAGCASADSSLLGANPWRSLTIWMLHSAKHWFYHYLFLENQC